MQHRVDKEWSVNPTALSWGEICDGHRQRAIEKEITHHPHAFFPPPHRRMQSSAGEGKLLSSTVPANAYHVCVFFFLRAEMRLFSPLGNKPFGGTEVFGHGGIYFGIEVPIFSFQKTKQGRICDFAQITAFSDFLL